ncbi:type II secretion system (T2SS) protein F [Motilibacter rhizosphaerae]|uniref:Type II secretion system (T2SS) protein F n=1 Tax=Motilibacter rhizosphaerae TaxID=598652 RepID=A0A4Q7NB39_9ACTN|nr:type II secretion system F family protein [Motilibacter rhizosphaerae]RZS79389.1 type II secretion system (T2SS) protein F [Motilibacter rhizosphaerae]
MNPPAALAAACAALLVTLGGRTPTARARLRALARPRVRPAYERGLDLAVPLALLALVRPAWAAVAAAVLAGGLLVRRRVAARRVRDEVLAGLPTALDALAAALRSGAPASSAWRVAQRSSAPALAPLLDPAVQCAARGEAPAPALEAAGRAAGVPVLVRLALCARVAGESGAALADAVEHLAAGCREDLELRRSVAVELAAPVATVRLLAALPVGALLLGPPLGLPGAGDLVASPWGVGCAVGAALLVLGGGGWWSLLVHRALPTGAR